MQPSPWNAWAGDADPDPFTADPTSSGVDGDAPAHPASSRPVAAACAACGADSRRLPASAKFCPRCGAVRTAPPIDVPDDAGPGVAAAAADVERRVAEWSRLRADGDGSRLPATFAHESDPAAGPHSLVLQGYANAMFRLGRRYECGHGVSRNGPEAVRCYLKAARLGNAAALDRLAPQCAGVGPPPLPPNHRASL